MDCKSIFMTIIRLFLDIIARIVYYIKYRNFEHKPLPPITNKLLLQPAVSLAEKIRSREVTSVEVVRAFIDRIKDINPQLNAVVEPRFEAALEEAQQADNYLSENPKIDEELLKNKPFFGVPFTTKDSLQVKGLRQTAGLYARKDLIADDDAESIKRIKDAGAIILGTTNLPELVMWWETSNTIYGATNNPYAFNRTPGGSSGGEGAIISAAGSPMGIGSDIGGSIRIPSNFNGIFGHKCSSRAVSCDGHFPAALGKLEDYNVVGPMAKYAADLRPILKLLIAPSHKNLIHFDKKVDFKDIKIYFMEDAGGCSMTTPVDKEIKAALRKTVEYFRTVYNVRCIQVNLPKMKDANDIFVYKLLDAKFGSYFYNMLANGKGEVNIWWEIAKKCVGAKGEHTAAALLWGLAMKISNPKLHPSHYKATMKAYEELENDFKDILEGNAIFLYPTHPTAALYHNESLFKSSNSTYTSIFNILGLPATQCPVGLNSSGLPLGVQVVGGINQDDLCLSVAEEIEKAFGGWVCPSTVKL